MRVTGRISTTTLTNGPHGRAYKITQYGEVESSSGSVGNGFCSRSATAGPQMEERRPAPTPLKTGRGIGGPATSPTRLPRFQLLG